METSMLPRPTTSEQPQASAARRAMRYGCASIGLILSALTPALADEEPVVRNDHLAFTYQIYDDGTVDAAWGAGKNIKTVEGPAWYP